MTFLNRKSVNMQRGLSAMTLTIDSRVLLLIDTLSWDQVRSKFVCRKLS